MAHKKVGLLGSLCFAGLSLAGAATAQRVYVAVAPPPVVEETRPVAPGRGYVWVGGYHTWNGRAYVWSPGRWALAPRPGVAWVPGHWGHNGHGYFWVAGHWR